MLILDVPQYLYLLLDVFIERRSFDDLLFIYTLDRI